ncbi:phenylacetate--CoA ligase family protein, partial [Candidatus Sumerlaeota bacterium]|nr:phenylacetate--CoA ligase family protein [Candidatus Sumerlaeota bacterium]
VRNVMYPWVFPLAKKTPGRSIMQHVRRWEEHSRWPLERQREHAWQRLRTLISHAYENVPLYQELYQSVGAEPGDISSWEDFHRLPLLRREHLTERLDDLTAQNIPQRSRERHRTSGSTGIAASFWIDRSRSALIFANYHLNMRWLDFEVGERAIWLWPDTVGPRGRGTWGRRIQSRLLKRRLFLSPDLSDEHMEVFHRWFVSWRPRMLVAFPTRVVHYLKFCRKRGLKIPQVELMISTGESLHEWQREEFESALGCTVVDRYGSVELGDIAQECLRQQGLHINTHRVWVETVPAEGLEPGQGMLVLTDLDNLSTPFIRYQSGDIGELWPEESTADCPCGRKLPRIARVLGRVTDIVESPSGKIHTRLLFSSTVREVPGIIAFQVVHRAPRTLIFRCQPGNGFPGDGAEKISRILGEKTHHEFDISVELVDELKLTPSGKLRTVIRE